MQVFFIQDVPNLLGKQNKILECLLSFRHSLNCYLHLGEDTLSFRGQFCTFFPEGGVVWKLPYRPSGIKYCVWTEGAMGLTPYSLVTRGVLVGIVTTP